MQFQYLTIYSQSETRTSRRLRQHDWTRVVIEINDAVSPYHVRGKKKRLTRDIMRNNACQLSSWSHGQMTEHNTVSEPTIKTDSEFSKWTDQWWTPRSKLFVSFTTFPSYPLLQFLMFIVQHIVQTPIMKMIMTQKESYSFPSINIRFSLSLACGVNTHSERSP